MVSDKEFEELHFPEAPKIVVKPPGPKSKEIRKRQEKQKPRPEIVRDVQKACYEKGLITETGGHYYNVIRFLPPLVLTKELAETGIDIFAEAVKEVEASKQT